MKHYLLPLAALAVAIVAVGAILTQVGAPGKSALAGYPVPGRPVVAPYPASTQPAGTPALTTEQLIARLSVTPTPRPPTATWVPNRPTATPWVIGETAKPAVPDYPSGPKSRPQTRSGGYPVALKDVVSSAALVFEGTLARIDPPMAVSVRPNQPTAFYNNKSPALLRVERVFKGPALKEARVAQSGACFAPTECTQFADTYRWSDLVGYQLIVFLQQLPDSADAPPIVVVLYVVHPDSTKDEVWDLTDSGLPQLRYSDLVGQIETASANRQTPAAEPTPSPTR